MKHVTPGNVYTSTFISTDSDHNRQVVPKGRLGVIRSITIGYQSGTSGTPSAPDSFSFKNGDSSSSVVFSIEPTNFSAFLGFAATASDTDISIPGLGIRFDDGICVTALHGVAATVFLQVIYN
tara:strand:+ start:1687 stop:2055 length:369 start_codon:yes stop_codon:yes gene_type:complete